MIRLPNTLFFEQVEAMLDEGREVRIRMRGNSMRPLLRNERDTVVLTPIAAYGGGPAGDSAAQRPGGEKGRDDKAEYGRVGQRPVSGIEALRAGDIVLFRHHGKHILHRIVRIERDSPQPPAETTRHTAVRSYTIPTKPDGQLAADMSGSVGEVPQTTVRRYASADSRHPATDTSGLTKDIAQTPPRSYASADGEQPATQSAEESVSPGTFRFTLAGDGNYRTTEQCTGADICAVVTRIVRPSGRIVDTSAPGWKRRSRLWLAMPATLRRIVLRVLHLLHMR